MSVKLAFTVILHTYVTNGCGFVYIYQAGCMCVACFVTDLEQRAAELRNPLWVESVMLAAGLTAADSPQVITYR